MITLFHVIIHHSHRCFHYHIYASDKFFSTCSYHNTLEFYRITSSQQPWMQQNTGQWHENMAFGTLPLNHFNFGQRTSIQSPWAYLLLNFNQSHPASVTQQSFIWTFCPCTEFSFPPAVILHRRRL